MRMSKSTEGSCVQRVPYQSATLDLSTVLRSTKKNVFAVAATDRQTQLSIEDAILNEWVNRGTSSQDWKSPKSLNFYEI